MKSKIHELKNNMKHAVSKPSTLCILSFCLVAFASCRKQSPVPVAGRGDSVTKTYDHSGFDRIDLAMDADVDYVQDNVYYIEVYAQSNIQKALRIEVDGSVLRIDSKNPLWKHKPIRVKVHSPEIHGIALSGSGNFNTQMPILTSSLDLDVSGSGSLSLVSVVSQNIHAELSGSGKLRISGGSATDQSLQASGSGDIDVVSMSSENGTVRLSGSGSAKLNTTKRLDVKLSGSGSVKYKGTPVINAETSGSGKLSNIN